MTEGNDDRARHNLIFGADQVDQPRDEPRRGGFDDVTQHAAARAQIAQAHGAVPLFTGIKRSGVLDPVQKRAGDARRAQVHDRFGGGQRHFAVAPLAIGRGANQMRDRLRVSSFAQAAEARARRDAQRPRAGAEGFNKGVDTCRRVGRAGCSQHHHA